MTKYVIILAMGLVMGLAVQAEAQFMGGAFSGASGFGLNDAGGAPSCPGCDSHVTFAVYEHTNADGDNDWRTDPTFLIRKDRITPLAGTVDWTAKYVLLYQIRNTNPVDPATSDSKLAYFAVTTADASGNPVADQPYRGAGYIENAGFETLSTDSPLDTPNDWVAGQVLGEPVMWNWLNAAEPISASISAADTPTINNPDVNGGTNYTGVEFLFEDEIEVGSISSMMFLTTNLGPNRMLSFPWAETDTLNPLGGAAGDVVGVKVVGDDGGNGGNGAIPEPSTCVLAVMGLVCLSLRASRRRRVTVR